MCVVPTYAPAPMCEHVYVSACAGRGCTKLIPVDRRFQDGSLWTERERKEEREMMMRVWWRLADGVQQGWSSLLMKSHLRPPFTLNMGHCSCPDLGFDPQRCLTPTIPQVLPPSCHLDSMHAYVYIRTRTHPQIHMHVHVGRLVYTCT